MKTPFRRMLQGLGVLVLAPLLSACYDESPRTTASAAMTGTVADAPVAPTAPVAPAAPVVSNAPLAGGPAATNVVATNAAPEGEVLFKKQFDPSTLNLSPGVADIVKMAQSGVSPAVMLEFINKSPHGFALTADEIVYLTDLGIPEDVIKAMLRKEGAAAVAQPAPAPAAVETNPPPQQTTAPAPPPAAPDQNQAAGQTAAPTTVVQQPVYVTQPQTVVTYQYFYDSLAPYGTWYYVSGYGYCWRPTVAVVHLGWRPYCHGGRWIYTTYGWYWQSDYTWGWAPFHYGRWYLHASYGWMWVPDTVWGPSWVTWRYADGYCGWAPLPPGVHYAVGVGFTYHGSRVSVGFGFGLGHAHYTFVSARHFTSPHVHQYVASAQQAQTIYNNTTIINNYIHGDNNTIINRGIAREEIVRHAKADIPTLAVKDLPAGAGAALRPDRVAREGNQSVVYRQTLPPSRTGDKVESGPVKAPAPAVAVLSREQRASQIANLAGGTGGAAPGPEQGTGRVRTGVAPAPSAGAAPVGGRGESKSPVARPGTESETSGQVLVSPRGRGARPAVGRTGTTEGAGAPNNIGQRSRPGTGDRSVPSGSSYNPPRRDLSPTAPAAPVAPSAPAADPAKPSVPAYTPPSPSYTPPMRREIPGAPSSPAAPSYTPPVRREITPSPSTPSTPSYTPPVRRENPPTPSTPSYTPPTRRETPRAPVGPSYTPPTRHEGRPTAVTPPSSGTPSSSGTVAAPTRPVNPPPTAAYNPPTRPEIRMPSPSPLNPPAYQRPANPPPTAAYNPPSRLAPSTPSPSYTPPTRSVAPSAPAAPAYSPPSRSVTPAYTPPTGGGSPAGDNSRRGR